MLIKRRNHKGEWCVYWENNGHEFEVCRIPHYYKNDEGITDWILESLESNRKIKVDDDTFEV